VKPLRTVAPPVLAGLAALNVIAVAVFNGYDVRVGPVHLFAHDAFKPLQYLAASLLFAVLLRGRADAPPQPSNGWPRWAVWALPVCVAAGYLPTAFINFSHPDWTQASIGASVRDWHSIAAWFTHRQPDGFYRPLGFVAVWIGYLLFGMAPEGYHLLNIALHALNVALAARLYSKLGFARAAGTAALLFAIAPVCAEPVVWPAARYDLLAAFFVLGALILAVDWLREEGRGRWLLAAIALLIGAGVLSKESAYAAPLLVAALAFSRNLWSLPRRRSAVPLLIAAGAPALVGIVVRLAIYGGLGGYGYTGGLSPVFWLSPKTAYALFTRLLIVPFAVATEGGITLPAAVALVLFAVAAMLGLLRYSGSFGREHAGCAICALLSVLPAIGIVSWVGPSLTNSRYLYLSSVWVFLLVGLVLSAPRMRLALVLYALAAVAAAASNVLLYRDALVIAQRSGRTVQADVLSRKGVASICLSGVPAATNGTVLFGDEVLERVRASLRGSDIPVRLEGKTGCTASDLVFRWNRATRRLQPAD
jgi:hypothetical protein